MGLKSMQMQKLACFCAYIDVVKLFIFIGQFLYSRSFTREFKFKSYYSRIKIIKFYSRSFTREFKFKSYYSRIKIIKFYEEGMGKIH
jgi:hypothetical protein